MFEGMMALTGLAAFIAICRFCEWLTDKGAWFDFIVGILMMIFWPPFAFLVIPIWIVDIHRARRIK